MRTAAADDNDGDDDDDVGGGGGDGGGGHSHSVPVGPLSPLERRPHRNNIIMKRTCATLQCTFARDSTRFNVVSTGLYCTAGGLAQSVIITNLSSYLFGGEHDLAERLPNIQSRTHTHNWG